MVNGAYVGVPPSQIAGTLAIFRFVRAFLAQSKSTQIKNPFAREQWLAETWDHDRTRHELKSTINRAINLKSGTQWPMNHRGHPMRKYDWDYQRGLIQDARDLNEPRLRIHFIRTPELKRRFAHRITRGLVNVSRHRTADCRRSQQ